MELKTALNLHQFQMLHRLVLKEHVPQLNKQTHLHKQVMVPVHPS